MRWIQNVQESGSAMDLPRSGQLSVSEEVVEIVKTVFQRSPLKSIRRALQELQVPKSTTHKVLHKELLFHSYKLQVVQALQGNNRPWRLEYVAFMLKKIKEDNEYIYKR